MSASTLAISVSSSCNADFTVVSSEIVEPVNVPRFPDPAGIPDNRTKSLALLVV